ncbi:MAG: MmcQ/YjbR family DNA-binding protein [Actinomycetota bacterium]
MKEKRGSARDRVRAFALALPEAYEDHPWGESVAKVNGKIFVFFGTDDHGSDRGMSVKLVESNAQALMAPGAEPTGYGLGKSGWVNVPFTRGAPPVGVLTDWVEESYRLVAPKRVSALLDDAAPAPTRAASPRRPSAPRRSRASGPAKRRPR